MVKRYGEWLVRFRWLVLIASILAVFAVASGGRFLAFTNDYRVFFSADNPQLLAFENLQATYTKNDNIDLLAEQIKYYIAKQSVIESVKCDNGSSRNNTID